jgi:hypothetical protein
MRTLAFLLAIVLIVNNGCVISPRRTVNSTTGSGGSNSEFSLSASPTSQVITAGASGTYTISVTGKNGFTGTVSLSASAASSNIIASLDNTTITGGTGSAILTVSTTTSTPNGSVTITVTATNTNNSVSQSISVTATIQGGAATAGAIISTPGATVPAGCIGAPASANTQRVSFPSTPTNHGFTATFTATPSSSAMDAALGFFAPASSGGQSTLSSLISFSPDGVIQVRDGDTFVPSTVPYAGGATYQFRLVENLPATTYSAFVTPPGATEISLGANLQVPSDQRGSTTFTGWGILVNAPDGPTLTVCNFSLQ